MIFSISIPFSFKLSEFQLLSDGMKKLLFLVIIIILPSIVTADYYTRFEVYKYTKNNLFPYNLNRYYWTILPVQWSSPSTILNYLDNYNDNRYVKMIDQDGKIMELIAPKNQTCACTMVSCDCSEYNLPINNANLLREDNFEKVLYDGQEIETGSCTQSNVTSTKICKDTNSSA